MAIPIESPLWSTVYSNINRAQALNSPWKRISRSLRQFSLHLPVKSQLPLPFTMAQPQSLQLFSSALPAYTGRNRDSNLRKRRGREKEMDRQQAREIRIEINMNAGKQSTDILCTRAEVRGGSLISPHSRRQLMKSSARTSARDLFPFTYFPRAATCQQRRLQYIEGYV